MTNQTMTDQRIDRDMVRAAMRAARAYTEKRPSLSITQKTEANYLKIVERLEALQLMPDELALSPASCAQYSSAYVTISIKRLVPLVAECARFLEGENVENINELVVQINQHVELLDKLKSRRTFHKAVETVTTKCAGSYNKPKQVAGISYRRKTKKCKKIGLAKAPKNWQNILLNTFADDKSMQLALAIAEITGCRPAELVLGVQLSLSGGGGITFRIDGVKVDAGRGQPLRAIDVAYSTTPAFILLLEYLNESQTGSAMIAINDAKQYSDRIRYQSRKLFPFFETGFSSYSYRHAFSAAQKKAGISRRDLAKSMGHRSCASQSAYGRKKLGRTCNGYCILNVNATYDIVKLNQKMCRNLEELPRNNSNFTMRM